jgi:hypothetical protein
MRFLSLLLSLTVLSLIVIPVQAQQFDVNSAKVTCPDGTEISNGAEIQINMRPGFTYTATAVGIDGFDPVIAILDENGVQACNDDEPEAANVTADLPTTGEVSGSDTDAQLPFSHNFNTFANISIVVGDYEGQTGEFLLILEGMAVTSADGNGDGAGDPFSAHLTQNMVNSEVPLSVYMLSAGGDLDAYIEFVDSDNNVIVLDEGERVECDDAGDTDSCWGESYDLSRARVGNTRGHDTDSMMSIYLEGFPLDPDPEFNYFNYLMTSYEQASFGDYIVVFHLGVGDSEGTTDNGNGNRPPLIPTPSLQDEDKGGLPRIGSSGGIELTCPDGRPITNGVEVIINMPRDTTYTATALGIGDFDPMIAVRAPDGSIECSDDSDGAISYAANLPTTGFIPNAETNAQIEMEQDVAEFANMSIVVGGFDGADGEFVLVLEGVEISEADGEGDPYAIRVTPNMIHSGLPLSLYMLETDRDLDPFLKLVSADGEPILLDDGTAIECDDGGDDSICYGDSNSLVGSFVTGARNRQVQGRERSAMLTIPIEDFDPDIDPELSFLNFNMTSYEQESVGEYVLVLHMGVGESAEPEPDTQSNI